MQTVKLPNKKIHKTPRLVMEDAYTAGSEPFESDEAKEKSVYYITFRKLLPTISKTLYRNGDTRMIFAGLSRILDYLFYEPITHQEIDEAKAYMKNRRVTTKGLKDYYFPEEIWRRVVDEFNGRPPLEINAVREGSVIYPNEPAVTITCDILTMGFLAAWFESKLLQVWSTTEMVTQLEHWLMYCKDMVKKVYTKPSISETQEDYEARIDFLARLMIHNFGDRAGICAEESEVLGEAALLTFAGTDTLAGGYQDWMNSGKAIGSGGLSLYALAHRNIQSFPTEFECFRKLYDVMDDFSIGSFVADCNDFWYACEGDQTGTDGSLVALALESKKTGNGKVIVSRPDSGVAVEQVLWLCRLAVRHGLYTEEVIDGKTWKFGTFLKFIEGDGMSWEEMESINDALLLNGFAPFGWGLYGVGGGLRNGLKRDNTSAKYALCSVGKLNRGVVKFSETLGKTTLPGPFKLLRSKEAIEAKKTIAFLTEAGDSVLIPYFNGKDIWEPFKFGYDYDNNDIRNLIKEQLASMPLTLSTDDNHNYPATDAVKAKRIELLKENAPKKLAQNYA
jgi:nicotinamide phosphoribosyltransferase